jgi:hypothetical protein
VEPIFSKYALRYAKHGFAVFPLAPTSKRPLARSHGHKDATTNQRQIEELRRIHPAHCNIGLATGEISNISLVDIDPRNGGLETEAAFAAQGKAWPDTAIVQSWRGDGGRHIYFEYDPRLIGGTNRLGPGIDIKSDGGMALLPPSFVLDKKTGRCGKYKWTHWPETGIAPAPAWLFDHLAAEAARRNAEYQARPRIDPPVDEPDYDRVRRALCFVPSDDRAEWMNVGNSLKTEFGEGGRGLWDDWSKGSEKFNARDQAKTWRGLECGKVPIGHIFKLRKKYGLRSPIYAL